MLGLFVKKHALAAVRAGFSVSVAYCTPGLEGRAHTLFLTETRQDQGLTEIFVTYRKADGIQGIARQMIAWNLAVKTAVGLLGQPGLIHAHILTRSALLAWWYARKYKVPFVITEHWSRYFDENLQYKGWLRKRATRFVLDRAGMLTVVSERLARAMAQCGLNHPYRLLPNVVDTALFLPAGQRPENKQIVSITCFEERSKNLTMLIDAFIRIKDQFSDATLILIGDGADRGRIREYADSVQLPRGSVQFPGMLEGPALAALLQQASCLALSSNYETFGIVAYEAIACGVPVVVTDVADLKSFVTHDAGRVVPLGDPVAFAEALSGVLQNPASFDREKMHERIETNFSQQAVALLLRDLYYNQLNANK